MTVLIVCEEAMFITSFPERGLFAKVRNLLFKGDFVRFHPPPHPTFVLIESDYQQHFLFVS